MSREYRQEVIFESDFCQIIEHFGVSGCGSIVIWSDGECIEADSCSPFAKMIRYLLKRNSKEDILAAINESN